MALAWTTFAMSAAVHLVVLKSESSIGQSYVWASISFVAVAVFCQFVYKCILYPDFLSPLRRIPTPKGRSWLRGTSGSMVLDVDSIRRWTRELPNNGLIRYYMAANIERIVVTGPQALNEVLVSKVYDFPKSKSVRIKLLRFTGNGLFLAEGAEHKAQRKALMPSFAHRHITKLYPIFWSKSVEMADAIEKQFQSSSSKDTVIQVSDWANRVSLDIIGLTGMGHDFGAIQDPESEFQQKYRKLRMKPTTLTRLIMLITMLTVGVEKVFQLPTKWNRESKDAAEHIREVARQIVREKQEKLQKEDIMDTDIASIALSSGQFSDENIVDQMMTFLVAGHETVATSLQWAVYALCKHPEMQVRLREEIRSHVPATIPSTGGRDPQTVTATQLDSVSYLNAFCKEVLRFYPPVRSTVREASKDTFILDSFIPKGTILSIVPGAINLDKGSWGPDAEKFNPERWIGEGSANRGGADSSYSFLTFLQGPRSCIGQAFAKSEFVCLVAVLAGRFQMELQDPTKKMEVIASITVAPKDGVLARLTRVEGW